MQHDWNLRRLGLNLRHYRHTRQMTQISLAQQAGCSTGTLSKLEHGAYKPSPALLEKLTRALNCDVLELLENV